MFFEIFILEYHIFMKFCTEPILPICRIRKLHRARSTRGPLALKDDFILVLFINLASSYDNMNDNLLLCGAVALTT